MDGVSGYLLSFFEFPLRRVLGGGEPSPLSTLPASG